MTWWLLPLTLTIFGAAAWIARGRTPSERCPTCRADWVVLAKPGEADNESYAVLACPTCTNTHTRVQGLGSRWAWCPACKQRALEAHCTRLQPGTLHVRVHETCHLCGHEATFELARPAPLAPPHAGRATLAPQLDPLIAPRPAPAPPERLGKVIPFPKRPRPDEAP